MEEANDNKGDGKDQDLQHLSNVNIRDNEQVHNLKEEPSFTNCGQSQRKASPKSRIEIPDVSPVSKRSIDQFLYHIENQAQTLACEYKGETVKIQGTEVIEEMDESVDQNCNECIEEDADCNEYDSQDELAPSDYLGPYNSESDKDD